MPQNSDGNAFFEGKLAAFHQKGLDENPHRKNSREWEEWRRGWYLQQVRIPLPSGVTLIPSAQTHLMVRHALGKQVAELKDRLEPFVRECWEHVEKIGSDWRPLGSPVDREFIRYRDLYLRVGKAETLLGTATSPRTLEYVGRELDEIELDLEEACH